MIMFCVYRTRSKSYSYEQIPAGYYAQAMESASGVQKFWHKYKFRKVNQFIESGDRVLDIGCGDGSFLIQSIGDVHNLTGIGIDTAGKQIDYANSRIIQLGLSQLSFLSLENGVENLPFEDDSFDVVTSIEMIEHIHPYVVAQKLSEMRRVLKPNGRLLLTTPNYRSLWPLIEKIVDTVSPVKYADQHINKYTPSSFVKSVEAAGFEIQKFGTFFLIAPFLACFSTKLARTIFHLEGKCDLGLGNLLYLVARKSD